jgi:predicted RNA-binding Zn-ribbon protein involved in translation (DUF1610 family)
MPQRFDKAARDEWLALGKSHTCESCCAGDCKDCSGTCDCSKCHGNKGASVLDALESKTADVLAEPAMHNPDLLVPPTTREPQTLPCTHCGAQLAPFVVEHRLNCPHCGHKQQPIRWEGVMGSRTAGPVFSNQYAPPAQTEHVHPNDRQAPAWGAMQACGNCGHAMSTFEGQRGAVCPNCGNEEPIMSARANVHAADVSMPPEGTPVPQKETALPYNPSAYEGEIEGMHPAAQYTYQRAVAQGAPPQAAMAAAQEKQGEMMKRTQEGQNIEGVQIPVINSSTQPDRDGFVSASTIKRVSHLI